MMTTILRRVARHAQWRAPAATLSFALSLSLSVGLSVTVGALLSACGGGGGGSNPGAGAVTVGISASPTTTTVGQPITLTWTSANLGNGNCSASGAWSGALAASGNQVVTAGAAGSAAYTVTCAGVASTASVTINPAAVGAASNVTPIILDSGPASVGNALNEPFVSVTLCRPGTSVCQTIDHILVDTGSTGLRLMAPLSSSLALPAVTTASGAAAGECVQFADGYAWGAVQRADVQIGGETAANLAIHVSGDAGTNFARVPSTCSSSGGNIGTVTGLGANGVLGVGLFKQDCGSACANSALKAAYYACSGGICSSSALALTQQVSNPVASFATDNNGVLLVLPAVANGGTAALTGSLVFGVNTQSNNTLAGATIYRTDSSGNFRTTYKGSTLGASFIDSGSNGLFFDDSTLAVCTDSKGKSTGFYCPTTPVSLSAVNAAADGSASGTVNFTLVNEGRLDANIIAAPIGGGAGSSLTGSFDWGLPFFYGRRVFVVIEGDTAAGASGPYWAY